jgi:hypothetical protein
LTTTRKIQVVVGMHRKDFYHAANLTREHSTPNAGAGDIRERVDTAHQSSERTRNRKRCRQESNVARDKEVHDLQPTPITLPHDPIPERKKPKRPDRKSAGPPRRTEIREHAVRGVHIRNKSIAE